MPAPDTAQALYLLRMQRIVDHIDRHLDGDLGLEVSMPLSQARSRIMAQNFSIDNIDLSEVPDTSVAIMSDHGDPDRLGETTAASSHGARPMA